VPGSRRADNPTARSLLSRTARAAPLTTRQHPYALPTIAKANNKSGHTATRMNLVSIAPTAAVWCFTPAVLVSRRGPSESDFPALTGLVSVCVTIGKFRSTQMSLDLMGQHRRRLRAPTHGRATRQSNLGQE
jgi:hypothetical protein